MKSLILATVLAVSSLSVVSAQESESFLFGVVKPGEPVREAIGSDPDGGAEHPKTSDPLIYGAVAAKFDPLFVSFIREPVASKELAVEEAWKVCETNNVKCDEVVWFQFGCGARATDAELMKAGVSVKATLEEAREDAVDQCEKGGGKDCEVRETFCAPKELN